MAHSKQAQKRIRTNEKRNLENKAVNSAMRTAIKKLRALIEAGQPEEAQTALPTTLSKIDKAAKKRVIHRNDAARKKSQMMRAVNAASAAKSA